MEYNDDEYPYAREDAPELPALLDSVEWDVLCIFDACRWDAFEKMCGESEPVSSPVAHTFEWVKQVWCNDEYDWSDVTYLSGNLMTTAIEDSDDFDDSLDNHVDEHVQYFDDPDVADAVLGTTRPRELTNEVIRYDPPIVVHYMQPHNPFIGNIHLNALKSFDRTEMPVEPGEKISNEAHLVETGHVSLDMYRAAYLENLRLVWNETERLRNKYDKVITTADHGESLGPDSFGHGLHKDHGHVVPFHTNWDVQLPSPQSVGASSDHEWVTTTASAERKTESETDDDGDDERTAAEREAELDEKLRSLGYKA